MFPCSIPVHGQALNITVESYCDRLDVGLIACRAAVPDVAQLADRMLVALAELRQAVLPEASAPQLPVVIASPPEVLALDGVLLRNGKSISAGAVA